MQIQIALPGLLSASARGQTDVTVEAITVREALGRLLAEYPELGAHLYDETGRARPHVLMFYNGERIVGHESEDARLRAGDEIRIVQAVSGG